MYYVQRGTLEPVLMIISLVAMEGVSAPTLSVMTLTTVETAMKWTVVMH